MSAQQARKRTMLIPREHGAWGMLLVPLATGAIVASRLGFHAGPLVLFVVATLALFWLRTPLEAWLGLSPIKAQTKQDQASVLRLIVLLCVVALASLGILFATGYARGLVVIGIVAAVAFGVQEIVKKLGRAGRMPAQIIGAIGLTSTAAGAYYVASGALDRTAVLLWIANWLFAADQIHFVQIAHSRISPDNVAGKVCARKVVHIRADWVGRRARGGRRVSLAAALDVDRICSRAVSRRRVVRPANSAVGCTQVGVQRVGAGDRVWGCIVGCVSGVNGFCRPYGLGFSIGRIPSTACWARLWPPLRGVTAVATVVLHFTGPAEKTHSTQTMA